MFEFLIIKLSLNFSLLNIENYYTKYNAKSGDICEAFYRNSLRSWAGFIKPLKLSTPKLRKVSWLFLNFIITEFPLFKFVK